MTSKNITPLQNKTETWRKRLAGPVAGIGGLLMMAGPAHGEDLLQALGQAYATNPDIQEARAQQRALDEGVPIARAPGLPSLAATVRYLDNFDTLLVDKVDPAVFPRRQLTAEGQLSVPIYQGGVIRNAIKAAQTRVIAGRSDLAATQANTFAQAVTAYLDVIRDESVVGLNEKNVAALEVNLQAATARFNHGELTKTDVAQSSERLDLARGVLQSAQVNLAGSRERYVQIIGSAPGELAPPPGLKGLPASPDEAVAIAIDNNPDLISIRQKAKAYSYDVKSAAGARLPKLSLIGDSTYDRYFGTYGVGYQNVVIDSLGDTANLQNRNYRQQDRTSYIGASLSIPIFQGGLPAAQERQASAQQSAALERANSVERQVIQITRAAYTSWRAADGIIAANQAAVDAAMQSLAGVRAENKIGDRTVLDILNAEQELVSAQVELVAARHDAYVAAFNLLTAMGRTGVRDLGLDTQAPYDPDAHYRKYADSIWDWASVPSAHTQSTTTVAVPLQNGMLK